MVFESVVVDVLNRFLGDYVVNLDTSQLSLGIWQGAVALKNLEIKENALSELDVPFKVKIGIIDKLNLVIPWTNLYTQPVEAVLDGIYLLIVPSTTLKYDAIKEEKYLLEMKQNELKRIEDAKQKMANKENPPQEKQDSFSEKLIAQIIKNLQLKISNIHVRVEDDTTNRKNPLSFGISLQNFSMETTDQDWKPSIHNVAEKAFCKLIRLDNLFGYWNVKSKMFHKHGDSKKSLANLKDGVVHKDIIPEAYDFVFHPISAQARLRMNLRTDLDFSSPNMDLDVRLHDISIELNKSQYFSIMELLESIDMMTQNQPYRKYKPDVHVHNNATKWWKYAITGILEVDVQPRLRMWSWKHILQHRQNMKQYKELYKKKIRSKKPTDEILNALQDLEKILDVFNITLARQEAEVEVKKAGLKIFGAGSLEENKGWFGWIWNWSESNSHERADVKPSGLEGYMTSEEKAKLYEAIGYSENAVDPTLPKTYEAKKLSLRLESMHISLRENLKNSELVLISLGEFSTLIIQRPGAQAIKFECKIDSFHITGSSNCASKSCLLSPLDDFSSLFKIMFETNPLDESVAQRCVIEAEPIEIIYDSNTVNCIVEFFQPPKEVRLAQLTTATLMKLEEFREKTSTGLLYIIATQKILDLKINIKASYIIIPQNGFYAASSNLLLLDLGHLKVSSRKRSELPQIVGNQADIEEIMSKAYDNFDIQLSSIQLLFSTAGDDWKEARKLKSSHQHILQPLHLNVELSKAMVVTDIRMPKFKVFGHLPLLSLQVSDQKLRGILELIKSIPMPQSSTDISVSTLPRTSLARSSSSFGTPQISQRLLPFFELQSIIEDESEEEFFDAPCSPLEESVYPPSYTFRPRKSHKEETNLIDFEMKFEIPEVLFQCYHFTGNLEQPMMELDILGLGTEIQLRKFDIRANAYLKEICLRCPEFTDEKGKPVYIVTTLDNAVEDLLTLEYVKANAHGVDLKTAYQNVVQLLKVNFSSLDIHLHAEALLTIRNFINNLVPGGEAKSPSESQIVETEDKGETVKKYTSRFSKTEDIITNLKVIAELSCLCIYIEDQRCRIAEIKIEGFDSYVVMKHSITELNVNLKNIIILDYDDMTLYKKVLYITGKKVFSLKMISYLGATADAEYTNMNVVDSEVTLTVGCIQVVVIMQFLYSVMAFINNFHRGKETLTEATVQATDIASGVKELAKGSSRLALDIHIKAPVVVIPQSSMSTNVLVADFGLITMKNKFFMVPTRHYNPPPVIDDITVKLSEMKLYRSQLIEGQFPEVLDIMQPINLEVTIQRNLSWEWYQEIPAINLDAQLKPMELIVSQEDLVIIFKMLYENIWIENTNLITSVKEESSNIASEPTSHRSTGGTTVVTAAVVEMHSHVPCVKTTLSLNFKTNYVTLTLYGPNSKITSFVDVRDPLLKLAEFKLEQILGVGKVFTDDSVFCSFSLKHCILEDKQSHIQKATPQMIGLTVGFERKDMLDVRYRRNKDDIVIDVVLQELYLCASLEFLKAVSDVFLTAYSSGIIIDTSNVAPLRTSKEVQLDTAVKWVMNILIKNPEIVFVADLSRHDAPSLVVTTQCEICWKWTPFLNTVTAAIKDLQVRACPFLPGKRDGKVTTVLQPCDLFYQRVQSGTDPQVIDISVKSLTLKISPIIINTIIAIMATFYKTTEVKHQDSFPPHSDLWNKMDTKKLKMWFLEESNDNEKVTAMAELIPNGEMIKMTIDSIFIVLEAGIGHRTVPMLLVKSYFSGEGKNWSTLINLHCHLELEVHYYNEMFGVWEPLLEPLEIDQTEDFRSWNFGIKMKKKAKKALVESDTEENYKVPEYKTVINLYSKDQLNITLSKCGLVMLNNLGTAFAEAAAQTSDVFTKDQAPFIILNSLGINISISTSDSFRVLNVPMAKAFELKNEESLSMDYVRSNDSDQFSAMTSLSSKLFFILLTPDNHSTADKIPLTKVGRGLYTVRHRESGVERSIICQIDTIEGSKKITIRSPVQMRNHFSVPFSIYEGDTLLGTALPENEFNIPLISYRSTLFLKPEGGKYGLCEAINFEEIIKREGLLLEKKCHPLSSPEKAFIINIVPEKDQLTSVSAYSDDGGWDLPYIIHLWPPVLLRNFLPYKIAYYLEGNELRVFTLNEGSSFQIYTSELDNTRLHLKLIDYLDHDWKSEYQIRSNQHDIDFINFICVTELEKEELVIAIHLTYTTGQTIVAFHSPYWMVNKTGRLLQYKADGIHRKHPPNYKKPILFSFQPKHFFNNNKVQLMVTDSELSDQFSIDTVGSHGAIKCKGMMMDYQVGVTIDLSSFNLTRIVTFTPFYIINNKSKYRVKISEEGNETWISLDLEQCIPFWPETTSNELLIQVENNEDLPKKIKMNKQENCILLNLGNELGGIIVQVHVGENSTIITFMDYHDGSATFLLINHTQNEIVEYKQSCLAEMEDLLPPGKAVLYTWSNPIGSRKLTWKCGKNRGEVTQKDDMMTPINLAGKKTIYLVSFFEGLQRIILFTEDPKVFKVTYENEKAELAEQEIVLSLQDVGISLVNNYTKQEVAYIGITSSDVVWETKPKKKARWRPLSIKQTEKLEREFKEYIELSPSEDKIVDLEPNVSVCLTPSGNDMKILQPHVTPVRRNYLPAVKLEYNTSAHQTSFRIQIYRIQIQNQIHGAIFPFVFYPIKPPKSVTMDSAPKPFTDVSIVMRSAGHSQISRIKYFKVLIQEMDLRLDLGFLYALEELMAKVEVTEKIEVELFHKDIEYFEEGFKTESLTDISQVSLYEYFHISPIKLHLSVSLRTGRDDGKNTTQHGRLIPVHSINLLLKSIGATLTDVQDVVFKLAFFELNYQFYTTPQLQSEVIRHYSKQAIKQMYVLILGLEVLGNPFGLIREFSEGVEAFFYEPYQGAIQGPEEFIEGMALGLKALVGGAVGGLAGAASKITNAMAKGVAAMTMDEDYQQKRREAMNKQPAGLREGITRGGKGLVSGFVSGITGIVTKPIKGAQKEGAAGFFKGVGKGLVGAVARPTGGIIDMASSTFQGIKRATENSDEVESLRPPRFFNEDGVIRPYRLRDGTGSQMLQVKKSHLWSLQTEESSTFVLSLPEI
ncbi:intermembrane lipid transfer protein VPS13A isoform X2 [Macrotis lagotis]|uniref:intermembrane lipid transfer protein VPS13A isoform X2 n=1 Tax=Macrotis lagotis TaxID=92651 RepID=UPI003D688F13